ncbi:MAG: SDR family oxidoreductase [Candidatus Krumholzibacteria bacterium]|nr:SDR family oxidoreductase [Candidatus Krumholzibacteria bacterium]
MKVLVTGHRGYIGSVLVPLLLERDHEVSGLDSDLFRACTFDGELVTIPELIGDVRDVEAENVKGFDAIIHLAGLSNDPLGDYNPSLTEDINHQGSVRLARLAKEAGVSRFLFASSCSNYGGGGQDFLDENARFNPITPYGVSKVEVEGDVGPMADDNFSPTFLRASTAYGMSPRIRFDLVVNNLTAWAFTTGEVHLKSDGSPWRPLVHVEDICRAYISILEADRELVHGKAFNIGTTTENYQIREVAEIVHDVVPNCEIGFAEGAEPDLRCYRVDCNLLALTVRGFKPQWTVRRGVEQLLEAYQRVGLTLDDFEGPRFKRIGHVKQLLDDGRLDNTLRWTSTVVEK